MSKEVREVLKEQATSSDGRIGDGEQQHQRDMIGDQEDDQLTYQRVSSTDKRATFRLVAETHPYPIQARRETNGDLRKWATRGSKYKYKRPPFREIDICS